MHYAAPELPGRVLGCADMSLSSSQWRLSDATVTLEYSVLRLRLLPLRYNATR